MADRLTLAQGALGELAYQLSQGVGKLQRDAPPVPLTGDGAGATGAQCAVGR
jgi:hypothetical protein